MHLSTQIIAKQTEQLLKYLSYTFDHPFIVVPPTVESYSKPEQLSQSTLCEWLQPESSHSAKCILSYNICLPPDILQSVLRRLPTPWQIHLFEYDSKSGELLNQQGSSSNQIDEIVLPNSAESTFVLQLTSAADNKIRIYFLPLFHKRNQPLIPSLHQIFKLLHVVKGYYSLDKHPEDQMLFTDDLVAGLSDFLYQRKVSSLKLILRTQSYEGDRVLQHVGRLCAPQRWLERQEYRDIKRQIYLIKKKQQLLLKQLHDAKSQVTTTINQLLQLSGKPDLKYQQISLDTLKQLKSDSLNKKAAEISELDNTLKALDLRKQQLSIRKDQILEKKQKLQQQQITDLLKLKNQVLQLQSKDQKIDLNNRVSPHKQLITTIFSRAQRKKEATQLLSQTQKTQTQVKTFLKTQIKGVTTSQFRQTQKKMAAVVRQGSSEFSELNLLKVRQQRQHAFLEVDFETEKQFSEKIAFLKRASSTFAKVIEAAEQMMFFDQ